MKSEFIRWEFGNHRKTVGSLQILGGLGLLLGLKYNILLVIFLFYNDDVSSNFYSY